MFLLNKVVLILNLLAAVLLLGSYLSPSCSPQYLWPVSFLGLGYVILLIANIIFVFYWLFQAKLHIFISLGAIILGFSNTGKYFQLSGRQKSNSDTTLKVVSFNIQNFDELHKGKNPYTKFYELLETDVPDILCMQEFNQWMPISETHTAIKELKKVYGKSFHIAARNPKSNNLIIVSKYKIIKHKGIDFSGIKNANGAMWADIVVNKDTIRVFNVHFQSFLLNKVKVDINDKDRAIESSKGILKSLKNGFKKREPQVDTVLKEMEASPYPIILCGDFNDTPMSYTYGKLTDNLKDAFIESGSGMGSTYLGPYPSFRIDYILHHPKIRSYGYKRGETFGSDHRMIQAELCLH